MPRKNPIAIIKDAALDTLKDPRGAAEKAVEQAKGTAAIGRMVAGQVTRTAAEKAAETVGAVTHRAGRRTGPSHSTDTRLRPVPTVNEPGHTTGPTTGPTTGTESKPPEEPGRVQGDPLVPHSAPDEKQPGKKGDAPEVTPADVAKKVAKKAPAKKAAKKSPAKKTAAKKTAASPAEADVPGDRLPPRKDTAKTAAKKAPAKKAPAKKTAKTAQQVRDLEGSDVTTPVGTTGAGQATNPDTAETDLQQPGTEPLVDPGTAKAARKEAETMQKGADPDKG